ncbi:MAG: hypothetical protein IJC71_06655 [Clostridia bacterium]|nr:hypothetical protein [Clostridia bacterium]
MNYIISRDVTMMLYALVLFLLVCLLHGLLAKIRRRTFRICPYLIGGAVCAVWEYLYSAGDFWVHNNGLRGAYYMLSVPVIAVTAAAVISTILGSMHGFMEK